MKKFLTLLLPLLGLTIAHSELRQWTSTSGQKIEAEIVNYDKDAAEVTIRRKDDKTFTLATNKLSEADRDWIKNWQEEQEKELEKEKAKRAEMNKEAGETISLKSDGDRPTDYHVYYPKSFDAEKDHPMLILFSPNGGGKNILKNVRQGCDALGWIAVGCDQFRNGGDEREFDERFTDLLPHIEKNVPHDSNLLYMGGFSGGALRAYDYSAKFERKWKGILAYGGWLGPQGLDTAKKMRVAIVNGDKDKNANHYIERDTKLLEKKRCKAKHISFPGGHKIAPSDITEQAMRWISEEEK